MSLFESHRNFITAFPGRSVYDWTVTLNIWNTTRDSEDAGSREDTADKARTAQTPRRPVKGKQTKLDMMGIDTINLDDVGMDEGLTIYEKMSEASA